MMGTRAKQKGDEFDVFSPSWRRAIGWRRGLVHQVKAAFWRRQRAARRHEERELVKRGADGEE